MTLWHQPDHYDADESGTHVLAIGVSNYTYLPETPHVAAPDDGRVTLGLTRVSTPAISAYRFAEWMRDDFRNPDANLASIRLLLAPSDSEVTAEPALGNLDPDRIKCPTRDNVLDELHAWKRDCENNRGNVAVLYIAGHGIQVGKDDSIVLLEDFGRPERNVLEGAIDIGSIWRAMATDNAAARQFYFIDACRTRPGLFNQYQDTPAGVHLDVRDGGSVESSTIFFSAAPRTLALGAPGEGTLFCQALLACLDAVAAETDQTGSWVVSTTSLIRHLPDEVFRLAQMHNEQQVTVIGGQVSHKTFHYLEEPPETKLSISLVPGEAAPNAHCRLSYVNQNDVVLDELMQESPRILTEKAGIYVLSVEMSADSGYSGRQPYAFFAMPSLHDETVEL